MILMKKINACRLRFINCAAMSMICWRPMMSAMPVSIWRCSKPIACSPMIAAGCAYSGRGRSGLTAEAAVERVNNGMRARLGGQRDAYLRDRLHDFEDLSNRLLRILSGRAELASEDKLPRDAIFMARTMGPAELLDYDRKNCAVWCWKTARLGAHVAIVARALGIPMLGDVRGIVAARDGQEIILDVDQQ
jgi:signal transduction protein with GAF and PtsI domain